MEISLIILYNWLGGYKGGLFLSPDMSAETEEQVMETARQLAQIKQVVYIARIWKPKTSKFFEGVGSEGWNGPKS